MRLRFKHIDFREGEAGVWGCFNTKQNVFIGRVCWDAKWSQYVYLPEADTLYSIGCLRDIAEFMQAVSDQNAADALDAAGLAKPREAEGT